MAQNDSGANAPPRFSQSLEHMKQIILNVISALLFMALAALGAFYWSHVGLANSLNKTMYSTWGWSLLSICCFLLIVTGVLISNNRVWAALVISVAPFPGVLVAIHLFGVSGGFLSHVL
ncbi:MAG TPA: hypothetical protein VFX02_10780 [Gammaproteobacteria bacterium]|nr:hypothetical protein [Gammaproteobacteria bacterium]